MPHVVTRRLLHNWLLALKLDPATRDFVDADVHRMTVNLCCEGGFTPHTRPLRLSDGSGSCHRGDRPALSRFVAEAFQQEHAGQVLATIPDSALWLHSKAQSRYLADVPDAQLVARFLRGRGLTDRFRGGLLVSSAQMDAVLPILSAQPFCGGADVTFAARLACGHTLCVMACQHGDLHFASPSAKVLGRLEALARDRGLDVLSLHFPEPTPEWRPLFELAA